MKTKTAERKAERRRFTSAEKCRAVLALWTERSSGAELCKELGTTWNMLNLWQEQAMEGMVQSLEPKRPAPCGSAPLNPRLQGLRRVMLATADAHALYAGFGFHAPARPEVLMEIHRPDVYTRGEAS